MKHLINFLEGKPLYGDSVHEESVPKIVEKYKDPSSKERFLRQTYGGNPHAQELREIDKLLHYDVAEETPTQYEKEWFQDFLRNAEQSQPVNRQPIDREYFEALDRYGNRMIKFGRYPEPGERSPTGDLIQGTIDVTADDLKKDNIISGKPEYDMNIHYHPEGQSDIIAGVPSGLGGDIGFARDLNNGSNNFIMTNQGDITQYYPEGLANIRFEAVPPTKKRMFTDPVRDKFITGSLDMNLPSIEDTQDSTDINDRIINFSLRKGFKRVNE